MSRFSNIKTFKDVKKIVKIEIPGFSNEKIFNLISKENQRAAKLLIVGEVQSGKTKNIIDLIKSSFIANGKSAFDIIIIFGGTTTNLNNQTKERVEDKDKENGLGGFEKIKFKNFSELYSYQTDCLKTVIYIGMKSNDELENILYVLKHISDLKSKRVLIIDDESDFGSLNTRELGNPSKYSEIIEKIFSMIDNNSALMSITATPYANLINNKASPYDYVITFPCKQSYGYKGISYFNNLKNFYLNIDDKKLWQIANEYYDENWKKLYYVFSIYIMNSLIKLNMHFEDFDNTKSDLLINIAYDKQQHKKIVEIINDILKFCLEGLPSFVNHLKTINSKQVEIEKDKVLAILSKINIVELNSDQSNYLITDYNIYVGGVLLSRGITYPFLSVEYIVNFPKNKISVDTLLQMCRWFGYRKHLDQYEYMNVITNGLGIRALKEVEEFNKIFYEYNKNDDGGIQDFSAIRNRIKELERNAEYVVACGSAKR